MLYAVGSISFVFGYMFFDLGEMLNQLGGIDILLIYAFMYSTALTMMFVIFRANGYLFNYKDYEILEPLPIKTKTVIMAKLTVMLTFIYLSTILFLAPIMFSYYYHGGFSVLSFIIFLIGFITIPVIPTIIFSFISLLISQISSRFRKNNIINIILLFIVFIGIMYLSFSFNSLGDANPLLNQKEFMDNLSGFYPPIKWFMKAVSSQSILDLLLLLSVNGILMFGFIILIQKLVKSTNQRGMTKHTRKNSKAAVSRQRPIIYSIASKEAKRFFNTPIYALNVGFGVVILFVLGIASLFFSDQIFEYISQFGLIGFDFELILLILIGFCLSMAYSTAISLSLEGKNFWILKSLPIKPKTVMHGKMAFNLILTLPVTMITLILFTFALDIGIGKSLLMMVFSISLSLAITCLGSLVNLFVPKFEWRNPAEVVKQSAGAILGMFGSWFILILDGLIYYFITKTMAFELGIVFITLFNLILATCLFILVNKKAESLFIKFEV
jgi:ABC-2 type transport system permease protein